MTSQPSQRSAASAVHEQWTTARARARRRHQTRVARRDLENQLASYRSPSEVTELLLLIGRDGSVEAEQMREVLLRNLHQRRGATLPFAS